MCDKDDDRETSWGTKWGEEQTESKNARSRCCFVFDSISIRTRTVRPPSLLSFTPSRLMDWHRWVNLPLDLLQNHKGDCRDSGDEPISRIERFL